MPMRKIIFTLIIITFFIVLVSCSKNRDVFIQLPQTQNPKELNRFGVTKYQYLKLRADPKEESETKKTLPLGSIFEILKKEKELINYQNMVNHWYYIDYKSETGWIFGSYIDIFNTYEEAEKKSGDIIFGENK